MRITHTLILLAGALVGGASGYLAGSAELVPGTYFVRLGAAIEAVPGFKEESARRLAPIESERSRVVAESKQLEEDRAALALLNPDDPQTSVRQLELDLKEEKLRGEVKLLREVAGQIQESLLFEASRAIHMAANQLGVDKGYEHIVVDPIDLGSIPWEKDPAQARELIRQRDTFWIHPDRDITDELIALLTAE